jgi:hypothetical protein
MKTRKKLTSGAKKVARKATAALVVGGSLVALSPTPASAHEVTRTVGGAVGTVGAAHSGARLCELSEGWAVGWMQVHAGNGTTYTLAANNLCTSQQYGDYGGIVRFRVGWDQGGGILWGAWTGA